MKEMRAALSKTHGSTLRLPNKKRAGYETQKSEGISEQKEEEET